MVAYLCDSFGESTICLVWALIYISRIKYLSSALDTYLLGAMHVVRGVRYPVMFNKLLSF